MARKPISIVVVLITTPANLILPVLSPKIAQARCAQMVAACLLNVMMACETALKVISAAEVSTARAVLLTLPVLDPTTARAVFVMAGYARRQGVVTV